MNTELNKDIEKHLSVPLAQNPDQAETATNCGRVTEDEPVSVKEEITEMDPLADDTSDAKALYISKQLMCKEELENPEEIHPKKKVNNIKPEHTRELMKAEPNKEMEKHLSVPLGQNPDHAETATNSGRVTEDEPVSVKVEITEVDPFADDTSDARILYICKQLKFEEELENPEDMHPKKKVNNIKPEHTSPHKVKSETKIQTLSPVKKRPLTFKERDATPSKQQRVVTLHPTVSTPPLAPITEAASGSGSEVRHSVQEAPTSRADVAAAGGSGSGFPSPSRGRRCITRARRSLPLHDMNIAHFLADSGSDEGSDADFDIPRREVSRLRQATIEREEKESVIEELGDERMNSEPIINEEMNVDASGPDRVSTEFLWSDDFTSFSGQKEMYRRDPGPSFISQDPVEIFLAIWDADIMGLIADETNKYARQIIEMYTDPDLGNTIPKYLEQWEEVTIPLLHQYFAVMICMSFCIRSKIQEYWKGGLMEMPVFRQLMSRDQFLLITKFLHFVSDRDSSAHGNARKICKIAPILDHCNQKFSALYIPEQYISLEESLLLWKSNLSWRQCIRSKATRFGIKSFELCEATSGYLLKCKLYTGKETPLHAVPLHGLANKTGQLVLDLMEGYLDAGHVLVMDNWYNQLYLTRYLKSRGTDVLGTMSRNRKNVPQELKDLMQNQVARGDWYARHSGDIALVTWKDVKLVTVMSTYHDQQMLPERRAGVAREKPVSVRDYNKYMGGVDLKDQKLSTFLFERKRCHKWYMKVFRRLVNTSLLNAFIIYTKNPICRLSSHRDFRYCVAEGLLGRFRKARVSLPPVSNQQSLRLQPGQHFPVFTEKYPNSAVHRKFACARCKMLKKRVLVRTICKLCQVPLCIGQCWIDYHTLENLSIAPRRSEQHE